MSTIQANAVVVPHPVAVPHPVVAPHPSSTHGAPIIVPHIHTFPARPAHSEARLEPGQPSPEIPDEFIVGFLVLVGVFCLGWWLGRKALRLSRYSDYL